MNSNHKLLRPKQLIVLKLQEVAASGSHHAAQQLLYRERLIKQLTEKTYNNKLLYDTTFNTQSVGQSTTRGRLVEGVRDKLSYFETMVQANGGKVRVEGY